METLVLTVSGVPAQVWESLTQCIHSMFSRYTGLKFLNNLQENLWFPGKGMHYEKDEGRGTDWILRYIMTFSSMKSYYSHLKFNMRKWVHPYAVSHFREVIFVSPLTVRDTAAKSCPPATREFRKFTRICTTARLVLLPGSKSWARRTLLFWFWLKHQEFSAGSFIDMKRLVLCS